MSIVFFFKQKTAYEMRISDWSSDVCSSDLMQSCEAAAAAVGAVWPKVDAAEDRICQSIGTSAGRFSDWAKSRRGCGNGGERSSTINSNTDPALAAMTPGPKNYA